jgi:hypothetical protein
MSRFSSALSSDWSSDGFLEMSPTEGWPGLLAVVDVEAVDDGDSGAGFAGSDGDEFAEAPPESDGSAAATPVDTATPRPTANVSPLTRDTFFDATMSCLLRRTDSFTEAVNASAVVQRAEIYARDNDFAG